ncbi:hypothetical protein JXJ21_25645 [candidate division KSB1 bacterium]|nr:hypothetical protein [candidate division KSB1 bacterium]
MRILAFKYLALVLMLQLFAAPLISEPAQYIAGDPSERELHPLSWQPVSMTRRVLNLNGEWQVQFGDAKTWEKLAVPGASTFKGLITFKRFFYPDSTFRNFQFRLVALGIHYECQIFINGKFIGQHQGGFTSFALDIQSAVIVPAQENEIVIKVNTRLDARKTLPVKFSFLGAKQYGGIVRDIYLLALPPLAIDGIRIHTGIDSAENSARMNFAVDFRRLTLSKTLTSALASNDDRELAYQFQIWEADEKRPVFRSEKSRLAIGSGLAFTTTCAHKIKSPRLWSPESPYLYRLQISLMQGEMLLDDVSIEFGIRDIAIKNGAIWLNGQVLGLRGINWYEFSQINKAYPGFSAIKKNILLLKELGVNCLRMVNQPAHPYVVTLCSRYGLLLMQELPVTSVPATILEQKAIHQLAYALLDEMLERDSSEPSVFAWGLGGYYDFRHPETLRFVQELKERAAPIDQHPTYLVVAPGERQISEIPVDIRCVEYLNTEINACEEPIHQPPPPQHCEIISFGYALNQEDFRGANQIQRETQQSYLLDNALSSLKDCTRIAGFMIMALADFRTEYPDLVFGAEHNPSKLTFGLLDDSKRTRSSYYLAQSFLRGDKKRLQPGSPAAVEHPNIFIIVSLLLILVFLLRYKRQRRLRVNISRSLFHPHGFFTDIREHRKIAAADTLFMLFVVSSICSVIVSSVTFFLRNNRNFDSLLNLLITSNELKIAAIRIIRMPELALIAFFLMFVLLITLTAGLTKFLALFVGKRIALLQAITFSCWSTSIFLLFLPLALIFYRLLEMPGAAMPVFLVMLVFGIGFLIRFLKGLKALYFVSMAKILLFFGGINAILGATLIFYIQHTNSAIDYIKMYF